jgi:hypothetical protein
LASEENGKRAEKKAPEHVLMCPLDWDDPECRKILGEYHKGMQDDDVILDSEVKAFENFWNAKSRTKVTSEYHKEGAPYLGWSEEGRGPVPLTATDPKDYHRLLNEQGVPEAGDRGSGERPDLPRSIDLGTMEVITYALFRAIFGYGVRIPIKREGMVDMDVVVRGKDVILNTNQLFFMVPDLAVWRVMFSHKGAPVVEFGRGVEKGLKMHRVQAIKLVLEIWRDSKRNQMRKAQLRKAQSEKADEEVSV